MIGRVISSFILISFGIFLTILSFFYSFAILIYSLPILVIGILILLNKEDKIEQIKEIKFKNKFHKGG